MFWVLVNSYGVRLARNLAFIKRNYEKASNKKLSDSSRYERFTPELVAFLKLCVTHGMEQLALEQTKALNKKLAKFQDVLIQDSTIIRLHKSLAKKFPAARSRTVAAGVKVSLLVSAVANRPKSISIHPESANELKTLRIGSWIKDRILLIDLGFYKHQLFARIKENGGYFVSRLKGNANPLIVDVHNTCWGNSIDVKGKYISEILPNLPFQLNLIGKSHCWKYILEAFASTAKISLISLALSSLGIKCFIPCDSIFNRIRYLAISTFLPLILDSHCFMTKDGFLKYTGMKHDSIIPLPSIK